MYIVLVWFTPCQTNKPTSLTHWKTCNEILSGLCDIVRDSLSVVNCNIELSFLELEFELKFTLSTLELRKHCYVNNNLIKPDINAVFQLWHLAKGNTPLAATGHFYQHIALDSIPTTTVEIFPLNCFTFNWIELKRLETKSGYVIKCLSAWHMLRYAIRFKTLFIKTF